MLRILSFICLTILLLASTQAQEPEKASVLIVDGFSNHDWQKTTAVTKWILESSKLFRVDVSTIPIEASAREEWNPQFDQYKVIVQNTNNIQKPNLRWPSQAEHALETYVKDGGGLYILHSANNAFPHWAEYDKMIGLGWRSRTSGYALEINPDKTIKRLPPGEGSGTGHGDRFDAVINVLNRHPINESYPDQWKTANTEVYGFPRGPVENITVLSYALDETSTKRHWPVEWVVSYGKGRVYNSSLGHLWHGEHYPPAYRCVGFQTTLIRATQWLADGKVTYAMPDDFPNADETSLKQLEQYLK